MGLHWLNTQFINVDRLEILKAKRIHVFENGYAESFGRSMLINPTTEKTWNQVLNHVSEVLQPSYDIVRHLLTVDGKESVHSFTELIQGARYVACGKEHFKQVSDGYRTEAERNLAKKKKCLKLYAKQDTTKTEGQAKYWALLQAQKNKRTVIYVFSNGQKHQTTVKFVLLESDLQDWSRTLSHISNKLDKAEGIRYLYTVHGHRLCGPCELQHGACYVAVAAGEKFQKMNYLDSYKEFVMSKRKTGEAIKQRNIGAISSPTGLEMRHDDCFLAKHKGEDKNVKHSLKPASTNTKDDIIKGSGLVTKKRCSEKRKKSKEREDSPSHRRSPAKKKYKTSDNMSSSSKKKGNNPKKMPLSSVKKSSLIMSDSDEVTVEEEGIKIVTGEHVETVSQITQTHDKNMTPHSSLRRNLSIVSATPECGIRIIGADELLLGKNSEKLISRSQPSLEEKNKFLSNHIKTLKEKLILISANKDNSYIEHIRHSVVSFSDSVSKPQLIKELKSSDNKDSANDINSAVASEPSSTAEETSGLVNNKSVAIIEQPEIITENVENSYVEIVHIKGRSEHRNTGFNFNYHLLSDTDDDESEKSSRDGSVTHREQSAESIQKITEEGALSCVKQPSNEAENVSCIMSTEFSKTEYSIVDGSKESTEITTQKLNKSSEELKIVQNSEIVGNPKKFGGLLCPCGNKLPNKTEKNTNIKKKYSKTLSREESWSDSQLQVVSKLLEEVKEVETKSVESWNDAQLEKMSKLLEEVKEVEAKPEEPWDATQLVIISRLMEEVKEGENKSVESWNDSQLEIMSKISEEEVKSEECWNITQEIISKVFQEGIDSERTKDVGNIKRCPLHGCPYITNATTLAETESKSTSLITEKQIEPTRDLPCETRSTEKVEESPTKEKETSKSSSINSQIPQESSVVVDVQQLSQKISYDATESKNTNQDINDMSSKNFENIQNETITKTFERAHQTGIIDDHSCQCESVLSKESKSNEQEQQPEQCSLTAAAIDDQENFSLSNMDTIQNITQASSSKTSQIIQELDESYVYSCHCIEDNTKETQTEISFVNCFEKEESPYNLKYYKLQNGSYEELPSAGPKTETTAEIQCVTPNKEERPKSKSPFLKCFKRK